MEAVAHDSHPLSMVAETNADHIHADPCKSCPSAATIFAYAKHQRAAAVLELRFGHV
jgi:hypothetical protein